MRMRAGLLAISLGLGCGALAAESAQKPEPRTQTSNEVAPAASWERVDGRIEGHIFRDGNMKGAEVENSGAESRTFFVPFGERSQSMEEMRARLADSGAAQGPCAPSIAPASSRPIRISKDVLNLDSTTHEALMELLTNQHMESLDAMFRGHQSDAFFAMHRLAEAENRKLDQLREVLGDDGLERYQEYTRTVHERRQVREVDAYLGATDKLSAEQKARLVKLFEEKNRMGIPPPTPMRMSDLLRPARPSLADLPGRNATGVTAGDDRGQSANASAQGDVQSLDGQASVRVPDAGAERRAGEGERIGPGKAAQVDQAGAHKSWPRSHHSRSRGAMRALLPANLRQAK